MPLNIQLQEMLLIKRWEKYYRDVIEKEYNIQNKNLWEKNLIEEFKNYVGN